MQTKPTIPFMITLPKADRDLLVRMAAERNLENPDSGSTPAGIGREIISAYLDKHREEMGIENALKGEETGRELLP